MLAWASVPERPLSREPGWASARECGLSESAYKVADGGMGRQMSVVPDLTNSRVKEPGETPGPLTHD